MSNLTFVIPAAGEGKRMQHAFPGEPKALIPVCGRPMVSHVIDSILATELNPSIVVVVSPGMEAKFRNALGLRQVAFAIQQSPRGTGDAVRAARTVVSSSTTTVAIAFADQPILSTASIQRLVAKHLQSQAAVTLTVVQLPDFLDWRTPFYDWGRVIRDNFGRVMAIVEARDATPAQLAITEVNPSLYCFKSPWVWKALEDMSSKNVQGELLLTEIVPIALRRGFPVESVDIMDPLETMGANTPEQLVTLEHVYQQIQNKFLL